MAIVYGSPFAIDWKNKDKVIEYANKLGKGMTVYKHPRRNNYNIKHTDNLTSDELAWVVYQTK